MTRLIFGEDIQIIGCVNVDFPQVVLEALPDYKPGTEPRRDCTPRGPDAGRVLGDSKITASILLGGSADFTLDYGLRNANYLTLINVADDGAYLVNEGAKAFQIIPATIRSLLDTFQKVEELHLKAANREARERQDRTKISVAYLSAVSAYVPGGTDSDGRPMHLSSGTVRDGFRA